MTPAVGTLQSKNEMVAAVALEPSALNASTSAWKLEPLPDAKTPTRIMALESFATD
jgi:hypothetical protein